MRKKPKYVTVERARELNEIARKKAEIQKQLRIEAQKEEEERKLKVIEELKRIEWVEYGSLDGFKSAYKEVVEPYVENGIMTRATANEIFKATLYHYRRLYEVRDIKVILKDGFEPTFAGSTEHAEVKVGNVRWHIYCQHAGGVNVLIIKTYSI